VPGRVDVPIEVRLIALRIVAATRSICSFETKVEVPVGAFTLNPGK